MVAECPDCTVSPNDVVIAGGPVCSEQVAGAAVFRGMVTTDAASRTEDLFCALSRWQQNGPLVQVNRMFYHVDAGCSIQLESLSSTEECSPPDTSSSIAAMLPVIIGTGVAGLVILLSFALIFCICLCRRRRNKRGELEIQNLHYER